MKTLLIAGALMLALVSNIASNPPSPSQPTPQWARIIHTVR